MTGNSGVTGGNEGEICAINIEIIHLKYVKKKKKFVFVAVETLKQKFTKFKNYVQCNKFF